MSDAWRERIDAGEVRVAVVGLGYVGLPLATAFGRRFDTVGFDIDAGRVARLRAGVDTTREVDAARLAAARRLRFTESAEDLTGRDVYVVAVPTPVDRYNRPDLSALLSACGTVGRSMGRGALVVFESTVYPGCTEEECLPVLASTSGLSYERGEFLLGYSPERVNPGDPEHTLEKIVKVTSGSTPESAEAVDALYGSILECGTHRVRDIKTAEAAKVIENTQRDLNIAFVNELAKIFRRMGLDTGEVLEAAGTKWNFLPFRPGLVGGHCIGVDPYYLTHKAQSLGYHPEIILAGRRVNDGMGEYVALDVVRYMIRRGLPVAGSRVLQLGVTFKENCPDVRNSRAVDVARHLTELGCGVDIFDPWVDASEVERTYGMRPYTREAEIPSGVYSAVVLTVAHALFADFDVDRVAKPERVVYDVKGFWPRDRVDARL